MVAKGQGALMLTTLATEFGQMALQEVLNRASTSNDGSPREVTAREILGDSLAVKRASTQSALGSQPIRIHDTKASLQLTDQSPMFDVGHGGEASSIRIDDGVGIGGS